MTFVFEEIEVRDVYARDACQGLGLRCCVCVYHSLQMFLLLVLRHRIDVDELLHLKELVESIVRKASNHPSSLRNLNEGVGVGVCIELP